MESAIVRRGRITNMRTKEMLEFAINPEKLKYKPGSPKHVSDPIPGFSHPKRAYASGEEESWSFTLPLDGDMILRRYVSIPQNAGRPADPRCPFSVQGHIDFIAGLCRPTDKTKGGTGAPDLVIFSFGAAVQKVKCDMTVGDIDLLEFDPQLAVTRAMVPLVLTRNTDQNEFQDNVWGGWG